MLEMQAVMASMGSPLPKDQITNMSGGYGRVYDAGSPSPYDHMTVPMEQQVPGADKAQMQQQMLMMQQ